MSEGANGLSGQQSATGIWSVLKYTAKGLKSEPFHGGCDMDYYCSFCFSKSKTLAFLCGKDYLTH
jgi:hypothetical protein